VLRQAARPVHGALRVARPTVEVTAEEPNDGSTARSNPGLSARWELVGAADFAPMHFLPVEYEHATRRFASTRTQEGFGCLDRGNVEHRAAVVTLPYALR
jgi:hypothetical protein